MTREELNSKKEMILKFLSSKEYKPLSIKEMGAVLQVPAKDKKEFRQVLDELMDAGKIHLDLKGKVKLLSENMMTGRFMATQKGFGFVRVEGEKEDIFIPAHFTKGAIDGDTVQIMLDSRSRGKRREAEVVSILERGSSIIVGTYSSSKSFGFVVADNHKFTKDIYIAKADTMGAITGHKVVVEITDFGSESRNPEGRVIEIIGHINDPGVDILSVVKAYGLPEEYPDGVMDQVRDIEEEVAESEKIGRADYRNLQTVTIDGEDAKDLDDAITLTKEGNIYHLGVHIADVSQYVTEYSPLDKEALKRGTSVYLVDRVIPMLPHKLSNGICSLNQGVDRLALSCMMDINEKGEVVEHRIEESVINVDRRMSYTSVHKIVEEEDEAERKEYKELIPMFELMYELAGILRERRFKRGSIDFDFAESKIILDPKGRPLDVKIYERNNAHRIIEEFMLAANQTVAEEYFWLELPFVYRTHEVPDVEKIATLNAFVSNFGYTVRVGADDEIHPKEIQKLIKNVDGTPEEALISRLALRSMKQAKYTVSCEGHFGLAMKYYCHFTSPIRRYPDLQIHRIIKENIHGKLADKRVEHYNQILPEVTAEASRLERRAEDAEREVEKMKKAEYMEQFVGETFEGIISGVTTWGMYVELPNTIEGMVRVADIPGDYYYFEEESYQMVGERTHKVYKLGQSVRVTVDAVDKILRTIDFVLAEEEEGQTEQIEEQDTLKREEIKQVRDVDFSGRPVSKRGRRKAKLAGKQPAKGKPVSADKKEPAKGKAVPADKKKPAKSKAVSADKKRELQERRAKLEKKEEVEKAFARKVAAKKKAEQVAKEVSKLTRAAKKAAAKRKSLKKAASKQARPVSRRAGRSSGKKK
ncbi:ribonuclease R [bacterium 1xD8-6]|nr:ribonuclease R [bacterium D16-36]RKI65234.1 ribonuclease R [bacterium 1xD8-6]